MNKENIWLGIAFAVIMIALITCSYQGMSRALCDYNLTEAEMIEMKLTCDNKGV